MSAPAKPSNPITRMRIFFGLLLLFCMVLVVRLFYLQIIQHDYYFAEAQRGQLKEYQIPAKRGVIEAYSGEQVIPLVLNEAKYTLFADPAYIENIDQVKKSISPIVGDDPEVIAEKINVDSRYVVLAKKLDKAAKQKIDQLDLKGIGTRETSHRTYPHGQLAAQLLGFVNDEGQGNYGIEQALDQRLKGEPGLIKAITDVRGVPLAANEDNVLVPAKEGERIRLTIDVGLQQKLEEVLKNRTKDVGSKSGSAVIVDIDSGRIAAMANYPTYNPSEFFKVENHRRFNNQVVSRAIEPGSTMKTLITAAGIDSGAIKRDSTYYDPNSWEIDGATIKNIDLIKNAEKRSVQDILTRSINTGSTWILMQMGGGELNAEGRKIWYQYMSERFGFGKPTGVEQGFEASGSVPHPTDGFGLNLQYANSTFGQGVSVTPLQIASALGAVLNGGTYYRPHLVETDQPVVARDDIVNPKTGRDLAGLMKTAYEASAMARPRNGYNIGGKTGSAQVPNPDGGYYDNRFIGTYLGYVGSDTPEYVIMVRVDDPKVDGYAGTLAARPIFEDIVEFMIDASITDG